MDKERPSVKKTRYMRLVLVEDMMIQGFRESEVVEICSKQWKVKPLHVTKLISQIKTRWLETVTDDPVITKRKYIERMETLYRVVVEKGQYSTAVKVQDLINKMQGVYEHERKESDGPEVITISANKQPVAALSASPTDVIDVETDDNAEGTTG